MRVLILHQLVIEGASPDERDVLVQVAAISEVLLKNAIEFRVLPCGLNLEAIQTAVAEFRPTVAFNLVESLAGTDALQSMIPALLEHLGVPVTGCSSESIFTTGRKPLAKALLEDHGLPTAPWHTLESLKMNGVHPGTYILKPVAEHASLGMVDSDVVTVASGAELRQALVRKSQVLGRLCFAEQFIDGREFNLSVVDIGARVVVLPPAEIRFEKFPEDKPRIVGSAAKWEEDSFEYTATVRSFDFPESDLPLLMDLRELAERCWISLGLAGYARVDFRIDEAGQPWILEANANPCLSPDAGLAAAASRADLSYEDLILSILNAAIRAKAD